MKIFARVMLIIAGVFAMAGIGLTAGGVAMGATLESVDIVQKIRSHYEDNDGFFLDFLDDWDDGDWDEDWDEDLVETMSNGEDGVREFYTDPVENVEIDLRYDELILQAYDGDTIHIEVENDEEENVRIRSDSNSLEIKSVKKKNNRIVTVSYPRSLEFKKMEIDVDAGTVSLEDKLAAKDFSINVGAGEFISEETITADKAEIEVGAGNAEISTLDAKKIEGECGMGNIIVDLAGRKEDYNYSLECGVGNISIAGEEFSGLAKERKVENKGASRTVELECGMGNIEVDFES